MMKLRINYEIEGMEDVPEKYRIALIGNRRLRTREEVRRLEAALAKRIGVDKVRITNWKVVGKIDDRFTR